ncbi:hypothetical protein NIES4073_15450 [Kalymmatonema gypsitolerans NIES-4073]|nr:hypothetical protein NIES4073_15450 [Scytonema sp. NIES-4073]
MLNNLEPFSHPPSKQEFAATFRVTSQISFWVQLALGSVSTVALLFASFSRNISNKTNNPGIRLGIFLAIISL